VDANWTSACGLQPELMAVVMTGAAGPDSLLLLMKPKGLTHHKGGTLIVSGDDGDECVSGWLNEGTDAGAGACARALATQLQ
jgi:hypothetical protein